MKKYMLLFLVVFLVGCSSNTKEGTTQGKAEISGITVKRNLLNFMKEQKYYSMFYECIEEKEEVESETEQCRIYADKDSGYYRLITDKISMMWKPSSNGYEHYYITPKIDTWIMESTEPEPEQFDFWNLLTEDALEEYSLQEEREQFTADGSTIDCYVLTVIYEGKVYPVVIENLYISCNNFSLVGIITLSIDTEKSEQLTSRYEFNWYTDSKPDEFVFPAKYILYEDLYE